MMRIPTDNSPSYADAEARSAELLQQSEILRNMHKETAGARIISRYAPDRLKRAFSVAVVDAMKAGAKSTAAAEHIARSSAAYRDAMDAIIADDHAAEIVSQLHRAEESKFDALRTTCSLQKAIVQTI